MMKKTKSNLLLIISSIFTALAILLFGLITSSWWLVRIVIFLIGGIPSFTKVLFGQFKGNPHETKLGIFNAVITFLCISITYAIEALI